VLKSSFDFETGEKNCVCWLSYIRTLSLFHAKEFNSAGVVCGVSTILAPPTTIKRYAWYARHIDKHTFSLAPLLDFIAVTATKCRKCHLYAESLLGHTPECISDQWRSRTFGGLLRWVNLPPYCLRFWKMDSLFKAWCTNA